MHSVSLRSRYRLQPGKHLQLTVRFGDAQFGTSRVSVDNQLIRIGEVDRLDVGEGATLHGKRLSIVSTVSDVNPQTDRLSASYEFSGGAEPLQLSLDRTAAQDGAAERFVVTVSLE